MWIESSKNKHLPRGELAFGKFLQSLQRAAITSVQDKAGVVLAQSACAATNKTRWLRI